MTHQKDDMDTEPLNSDSLWQLALDECNAFECDNDGRCDEDGMHFRNRAGLLRFAALVIDRTDAALASKPDAAPAGAPEQGSMEEFGEAADLVDKLGQCATKGQMLALLLGYRKSIRAALAAAPVVPPSLLGASPCGGPGSAASGPSPSVSALRAPIPGATPSADGRGQ